MGMCRHDAGQVVIFFKTTAALLLPNPNALTIATLAFLVCGSLDSPARAQAGSGSSKLSVGWTCPLSRVKADTMPARDPAAPNVWPISDFVALTAILSARDLNNWRIALTSTASPTVVEVEIGRASCRERV